MVPTLDDLAVLQHHDRIGVAHSGQPMCDHKGGPVRHQTVHAVLDAVSYTHLDVYKRQIMDLLILSSRQKIPDDLRVHLHKIHILNILLFLVGQMIGKRCL